MSSTSELHATLIVPLKGTSAGITVVSGESQTLDISKTYLVTSSN